MSDIIDVKLTQDNENIYDLSLADNGDLLIDESFDTTFIVSLFTDARADETEIPTPQLRRGFWAYEGIGSKLWLLQRRTVENRNRAEDFVKQSIQWMVEMGFLKSTRVEAELIEDGFGITVTFVRFDNSIETLYYEAWNKSEFN